MTGPEHYRAAEGLPTAATTRIGGDDRNEWLHTPDRRAELAAQAQVHATLADAAATAMSGGPAGLIMADWDAWLDAASAHVRPGGTA